jgi:dTDP-4-amino-4,6-dideoxygalactose transaminase
MPRTRRRRHAGYYRLAASHRQALLAACARFAGVPQAERAAGDVVALPMYPQMSEEQVVRVVEGVEAFPPSGGAD